MTSKTKNFELEVILRDNIERTEINKACYLHEVRYESGSFADKRSKYLANKAHNIELTSEQVEELFKNMEEKKLLQCYRELFRYTKSATLYEIIKLETDLQELETNPIEYLNTQRQKDLIDNLKYNLSVVRKDCEESEWNKIMIDY